MEDFCLNRYKYEAEVSDNMVNQAMKWIVYGVKTPAA